MQRHSVGLLAVAVVGGLSVALWPDSEEDAEAEVRRLVVAMTAAAQKRQLAEVLAPVSDAFSGDAFPDKQAVKQVLTYHVLRGQWVRIFTTDLHVRRRSDDEVEVSAKFIFGRSDATELRNLSQESVLSTWGIEALAARESDGQWKFVWARHEELDPRSLF